MKKSRGYSLIEVLVAVMLISIFLVFVFGAITLGRVNINNAKHRKDALSIAKLELEGLLAGTYAALPLGEAMPIVSSISSLYPDSELGSLSGSLSVTVVNYTNTDLNIDAGEAAQLTATVSWQEPNPLGQRRTLTETLTTIKGNLD